MTDELKPCREIVGAMLSTLIEADYSAAEINAAFESLGYYRRSPAGGASSEASKIAESDADYWLANRAKILDAIAREGLTLVSSAHGFRLLRLGKIEAQAEGEQSNG